VCHATCLHLVGQLLIAQAKPTDTSPWMPLWQWSDIPVAFLGKFVVLPLLVAAVVWAVVRYRTRRAQASYFSPRHLFNDLCALHGLDWPTRKLLRQLVRAHELEHPARVFLEPSYFEADHLPPTLQPFSAELRALKARLF